MTGLWHEEVVQLLKQFTPDVDIVLVLLREDSYYIQPSVQSPDNQQNGQVSHNTNSNNSNVTSGFATPPQYHQSEAEMPDSGDLNRYPVEV